MTTPLRKVKFEHESFEKRVLAYLEGVKYLQFGLRGSIYDKLVSKTSKIVIDCKYNAEIT